MNPPKSNTREGRAYPIKLRQKLWDFLDALAARHPELHMSQIFEQAVDLFKLHTDVLGYGGVMRQLDARVALELYAKNITTSESDSADL